MTEKSLKSDLKTHFDFGENWSAYATTITEADILEAEKGLLRLLSLDQIQNAKFLDIGCGSGLHSLAAIRLGAASVSAFDFDPLSVATTEQTLNRYAPDGNFTCQVNSILADHNASAGAYDIVYSWGVLHHTGSMWEAIENATKMVAPGGKLVIAIYLKTRFCWFWKREKRLFTTLPNWLRLPIVWSYAGLCILRILARKENPYTHIAHYNKDRGMNWYRDRVDWLGGYPYESASAEEIIAFLQARDGRLDKSLATTPGLGVFGSGCAEYVFTIG